MTLSRGKLTGLNVRMTQSDQRLLDILSFWHKLEFFIPFDLDHRARTQKNQKKIWRAYDDLSQLTYKEVPDEFEVVRYTLFLGVFDKAVVRDLLENQSPQTEHDSLDEGQRAGLEGLTCMASIELSPEGTPVFDNFAVSTLPWAIGQTQARGLDALSSESFQQARARLEKELFNFASKRQIVQDEDGDDRGSHQTSLAPQEVETLIDLLTGWSGFRPTSDQPAALLEVMFGKSRPEEQAKPAQEDETDWEEEDTLEIGILNSFFIEDIERAMAVVAKGQTPRALRQYLTPLPAEARVDLYGDAGRAQIIAGLSPTRQNVGRWFANPDHAMSLMQQFAINTGLS